MSIVQSDRTYPRVGAQIHPLKLRSTSKKTIYTCLDTSRYIVRPDRDPFEHRWLLLKQAFEEKSLKPCTTALALEVAILFVVTVGSC